MQTIQDPETVVSEVNTKTLDLVNVGEQLEAVGDAMSILSARLISLARTLKGHTQNTRPGSVEEGEGLV